MIELRGVGLVVGARLQTRILAGVDLDVDQGSTVAIIGPSGAGKTTLASIIGALQAPSEGTYVFDGRPVTELNGRQLARFRAENLGYVFQNSHLIEERTSLANVDLGIRDHSMRRDERMALCRRALVDVGLASVEGRRAADLSGGEKHRVAIARALVGSPRLIIADEPTSALDQATGAEVLDLLASIPARGATLIVVTHDERAAEMADQVVTIVDGLVA
jgi:ABC-type lipoprotein export system ATPase subunit